MKRGQLIRVECPSAGGSTYSTRRGNLELSDEIPDCLGEKSRRQNGIVIEDRINFAPGAAVRFSAYPLPCLPFEQVGHPRECPARMSSLDDGAGVWSLELLSTTPVS